jgi:hypothetical protein
MMARGHPAPALAARSGAILPSIGWRVLAGPYCPRKNEGKVRAARHAEKPILSIFMALIALIVDIGYRGRL